MDGQFRELIRLHLLLATISYCSIIVEEYIDNIEFLNLEQSIQSSKVN